MKRRHSPAAPAPVLVRTLLAVLALAFGLYLLADAMAPARDAESPRAIGIVFVGSLFHGLIDLAVERLAVRT